MKRKLLLGAVAIALLAWPMREAAAQQQDLATWTSVEVVYDWKKAGLELDGLLEWRTKDRIRRTDCAVLYLAVARQVRPWLSLGTNYELSYNNLDEQGWIFYHCYRLRATFSTRLCRWLDVSLREKYEHTLARGGFREMLLRQRLRLACPSLRGGVEPYVSVETFNSLFVGDGFRLARTRYRGGAAFPLGEGWTGDVFYLYQDAPAKGTHVLGLAGTYRF